MKRIVLLLLWMASGPVWGIEIAGRDQHGRNFDLTQAALAQPVSSTRSFSLAYLGVVIAIVFLVWRKR